MREEGINTVGVGNASKLVKVLIIGFYVAGLFPSSSNLLMNFVCIYGENV